LGNLDEIINYLAYGVVPNLIDVLASMLPMLGMAKQDVHKTGFASGKFCVFCI
jgi:hypothetical protein